MIYLRARYYDPATAQFLSIDTLIDLTQIPYGYTDGNPLQFVDPLGLLTLQQFSDAVAGFGDTITFGGTRAIRDLINYEMDYEDTVNDTSGAYTAGAVTATITTVVLPTGSAAYGIANTVGAGVQGTRAVQSGDSAGAVLNGLAVATGAGGVVSAFGRAFSWAAAASGGSSFVRSGTWWSRLGQISGHIEWFGDAALTGATTAHLVGQTC